MDRYQWRIYGGDIGNESPHDLFFKNYLVFMVLIGYYNLRKLELIEEISILSFMRIITFNIF